MSERLLIWLAWKMPRRLAYWVYVRVASEATGDAFSDRTPDDVSLLDALEAWRR